MKQEKVITIQIGAAVVTVSGGAQSDNAELASSALDLAEATMKELSRRQRAHEITSRLGETPPMR